MVKPPAHTRTHTHTHNVYTHSVVGTKGYPTVQVTRVPLGLPMGPGERDGTAMGGLSPGPTDMCDAVRPRALPSQRWTPPPPAAL